MTDTRIQQLKRVVAQGDDPEAKAQLLAEQLRVGERVPGEKNKPGLVWWPTNKPCASCDKMVCHCKTKKQCPCHDFPRPEADLHSMLQFRAYCGDELAQRVMPIDEGADEFDAGREGSNNIFVPLGLTDWITSFLRLAEALPDVVVSGECEDCKGTGKTWSGVHSDTPRPDFEGALYPCECKGTGIITTTTSAKRYLAACAGLAVGRAVRDTLESGDEWRRSGDALNACERWTWCPCPSNAEAWNLAWEALPSEPPYDSAAYMWIPSFNLGDLEEDALCASRLIGEGAIREAVRLMMLRVTS